MLYADDLILIGQDELELQWLLDELGKWCAENRLKVNDDKSKIIHFRTKSAERTNFSFKCDETELETVTQYTYLGLLLNEHLDYNVTARYVAKAGNRALGLIIAKDKAFGGLAFRTFTKLYGTMVWSVISYAVGIWGQKQYSCINAVQNRAQRYFLGVGRYIPNVAVHCDIGWHHPAVKTVEISCKCMVSTRIYGSGETQCQNFQVVSMSGK